MSTTTKILFALVTMTALLGTGCKKYGKKLKFNGSELYYKSPVTKAQATKLGNYLVKQGVFKEPNKGTVQIRKPGERLEIRFVVKDGYEKKPMYLNAIKLLTVMISKDVFKGRPLDLHLCGRKLQSKVEIPWEECQKATAKGRRSAPKKSK